MKMNRIVALLCCSLYLLLPLCSNAQQEWEWVNTIRSLYWNGLHSTTLDNDGNLIICGSSSDTTLADGQFFVHTTTSRDFLAKISPQGNILWYKPLSLTGGGEIPDIQCDRNNNILLIAGTKVFKFSSLGDTLWAREITGPTHNGSGRERVMVRSADNSIILYGTFQHELTVNGAVVANSGWNTHGFFIHFNDQGQLLRANILGRTRGYVATKDLARGPEEGMLVSGTLTDTAFFGDSLIVSPSHTSFVAYFDSSFTLKWVKTGNGLGEVIAIDSTGFCYASRTVPTNQPFNVLLFDSLGTQLSIVKATKEGTLYDLAVDRNQNLYTSLGVNESEENYRDLYFAKFDSQGKVEWLRHIGAKGDETSGMINASADGDVYASGLFGSANLDFPPFSISRLGKTSISNHNIFVGKIASSNLSVGLGHDHVVDIRVATSDRRLYLYIPDDAANPVSVSIMTGLATEVHRYSADELIRENGRIVVPLKAMASGLYFLRADVKGVQTILPFVVTR